MRRKSKPVFCFSLSMLLFGGCHAAESPPSTTELASKPVVEVVGRLEDKIIREASGLARSQRQPGLLWTINDHGAKNIVHALSHTGEREGEFLLKKTEIRDWEDLASFQLDDKPYLMVADIGDNDAERKYRTLYFVKEPKARKNDEEKGDWQVDYVYPDGPRDSESAAVDIDNQTVLILSKRDLPPRLYESPLRAEPGDRVTVTLLGAVTSLRVPTRQQIEYAPKTDNFFWQPAGMDISEDNRAAVILTYGDVYYYERHAQQSWLDALNSKPIRVSLGNFENAEAIAFGDDERLVFVTGENKHSRLLRINFNEVISP
jgi:hypothetical protein